MKKIVANSSNQIVPQNTNGKAKTWNAFEHEMEKSYM